MLLWRKKVQKLRWYLYDKTEQKLDAQRFAAELRYLFVRFEPRPDLASSAASGRA
jgi:hypothetical protein